MMIIIYDSGDDDENEYGDHDDNDYYDIGGGWYKSTSDIEVQTPNYDVILE